eukprot:5027573-Alexandrium_andersonii.AAC.1
MPTVTWRLPAAAPTGGCCRAGLLSGKCVLPPAGCLAVDVWGTRTAGMLPWCHRRLPALCDTLCPPPHEHERRPGCAA